MILSDQEVEERINSPLNLLNRLRSVSKAVSPSLPERSSPKSEDIIGDLEDKIKVGKIKGEAAVIMAEALAELKLNIGNVKPEKLADIAEKLNKIVTSSAEREKDKVSQIIVYAPQLTEESNFQIVYAD